MRLVHCRGAFLRPSATARIAAATASSRALAFRPSPPFASFALPARVRHQPRPTHGSAQEHGRTRSNLPVQNCSVGREKCYLERGSNRPR